MKKIRLTVRLLLLYAMGYVLVLSIYIVYANHYINPKLSSDIDKMLFARYEFLDPDSNLVNFNEEFEGKIKLIDFWTLNCSFCTDDIEKFYELDLTKNANFYILAVNKDELAAWQDFLDEGNYRYKDPQIKHFHLEDKAILNELEVEFYPTYFLISPDGKIHSRCSYNFVLWKIKKVLDHERYFSDYVAEIYKYFPCGGLGRPTLAYTFVIYPVLLIGFYVVRKRFKRNNKPANLNDL